MRWSFMLVATAGGVLGLGGLLLGGVLLSDRLDGRCQKDEAIRLNVAYKEFKSYIKDIPVQSYETVATRDSGDCDSHLEVKVRPDMAAAAVERRFQGDDWKREVDVQGDLYYLAQKAGIEFQVYIGHSRAVKSHQVVITVYPWFR